MIDALWQDLRYGLRILRKNPTFSLVAILALALGTGANTAIFQLVDALRLRALPVAQPNELVSIGIDQHGKGRVGRGYGGRSIFTEPLWQEIRRQQQPFSALFAWGNGRWDLSTEGEAVFADGFYVSGGYFDALGVHASLGRLFTQLDDQNGCGSPVAVLSYAFWQARFGGDRGVIGRTILLDRRAFPVIGVAPEGFFGVEVGRTFDVALPLCAAALLRGRQPRTDPRAVWWLDMMGRLQPGWTTESAAAHLAAISSGVFQATVSPTWTAEWAKNYASFTLTARPGATGVSDLRSAYAPQLWALLGATGLVLLLTCANLANLLLARATARGREVAVRLAIGASRRRIVRQMLSESMLLAVCRAVGGLLLARWISRTLVMFLNAGGNRIVVDLMPDGRVFAFMAMVTVLTCVLFGLSPALKVTRRDLANAMQPGGRSSTEGHEALALRRGLVIVQVALSMVLVVGALLFGRTLRNLTTVDLGFDPDVMVASVDLSRTAVQPEGLTQAYAAIVARLDQVPGVSHAAEALIVPLSGGDWNGRIVTGGVVQDRDVHFNEVGGDYFRVLGTPLVAGRTFDSRDRPDAPKSAIVNETFVRRYSPNADPIGQTFQMELPPGSRQPTYHIVGVVGDAKYLQLREERAPPGFSADEPAATFLPMAYLAVSQDSAPPPDFRIVVRSGVPPASLTRALARAITEVAPGAAVSYDAVTNYIDRLLLRERLMAWLSGCFGMLAILIAAIGLYGVMAYNVTRRRIEIGVRMALGAHSRDVIRMVLVESCTLVAIGAAIGVVLATVALRYAAALLYGVRPLDATSFALGIIALALVSFLATWIPARRASRLAPTVALRE